MKFLVSKDIHSNPNFSLLLGLYSLMMLFYFIGDLFYFANFFGSTVNEVLFTLKGNPDEFIEPLSLLSLLEYFHISLFLAILAMFTTMAIILRIRLSRIHKRAIITLSMFSLLLSFLSLAGAYFFSDFLAYGFAFFTVIWHMMGLYALSIILFKLGTKQT